jgi:hypothetical protein
MQQTLSDEFKGILFGSDGWKRPSEIKAEDETVQIRPRAPYWDGRDPVVGPGEARRATYINPPWDDAWPNNSAPRRPCTHCNKMKPINLECTCTSLRRTVAEIAEEYERKALAEQGIFDHEVMIARQFAELREQVARTKQLEDIARQLAEHDQPAFKQPEAPVYKQGTQDYIALLEAMRDLHIRKNNGYSGHSTDTWFNFRACERWGGDPLEGIMHRMTDKWSRLESLTVSESNDQVGETKGDTLMDLAAYALILVCLRQERGLK